MKSKKKPLDPRWVAEMMSYIIGPQMTILMMKNPKSATELTTILHNAITDLYDKTDYPNTNAWVVASGERLWDLYNTYMTAKLMKLFDNGVPDAKRIVVPGSDTLQ